MDPTKALNFQTFPHQGGPIPYPPHTMQHQRAGSQSMPRPNRYARKNSQGGNSIYSPAPEYDDPANYEPEEDQYRRINPSYGGSQYGGCGNEYDTVPNCAPEEDQYGPYSAYGAPYSLNENDRYDGPNKTTQLNESSPPIPPPR
jgi:hypothetical protein